MVANLVLVARTETPVDGIRLRLRGSERRTVPSASAEVGYEWLKVPLVDLEHSADALTLEARRHDLPVAFQLPPDLPPAHRSASARIEYSLDVHVQIPWWPDRRASFAVPIGLRPRALGVPSPVRAASEPRSPQDLSVELSLETALVTPGTTFVGAVSLQNLRGRSLRRVDVTLLGLDRRFRQLPGGETEAFRTTATIFQGTPEEGAPLPFSILFPRDVVPSFEGRFGSLAYVLELRVVVAWQDDLVVRLPVTVVPAGSVSQVTPRAGRRIPPVGAERRAEVWAHVARKGLDFDAETERLHALIGGVRLAVAVEQRGTEGLWTTASLRWPALGIDLRAANRSWHDVLRPAVPLASPFVGARLTVRGREPAQTAAFFDALGVAPLPFEEVTFDDDGCMVASPGGGFEAAEVERFVDRALELCRAVEAARLAVPAPTAMAHHLPVWRDFALRLQATLFPGEPRIEAIALAGERCELVTLWQREQLAATELAVVRSEALAGSGDAELPGPDPDALSALPGRVRAALAPQLERGATLEADRARLALRVPGAWPDPDTARPIFEALAEWARALRATPDRGPYR